MATLAAARSMLRSTAARSAAARIGSQAKSARSLPRLTARTTLLRRPVEMSFCVESMLPYHTATSSALMTSLLSASGCSYGWLSEACNDDV